MDYTLTDKKIKAFALYLREEERSAGTIKKYLRDVKAFSAWAERAVTKEAVTGWKEHLLAAGYAAVTINSMLAALNGLFRFLGWDELRVKYLKIQRKLFRDAARELSRSDYDRLLAAAKESGRERLALVIETLGATGIRVSEAGFITVAAARLGRAEISMKGKIRTVLLPAKLCRKLLDYARKNKIASGEIFLTGSGKRLSRGQIWAELKRLAKYAGVETGKVFPHNLRHLFAATYYRAYGDVVRLADVLGHSSVETTRIYLVTTGAEQKKQLDRLGLVS